MRGRRHHHLAFAALAGALFAAAAGADLHAQAIAARLAILQAEARPNLSNYDLVVIKNGTRSNDIETVRLAVRTLGRLERPSQIPDLLISLRHVLPEVRVEAANAIAQAAQGFLTLKTPPTATTLQSTQSALIARLKIETEPDVRAALCEALARLPYKTPADVARAESAILDLLPPSAASTEDRLGIAKGLEALFRIQKSIRPPGPEAIAALKAFVREATRRPTNELLRAARIRRLAVEGLTSAGALDEDTVTIAAGDPDAQVRRLAMRAAAMSGAGMAKVREGLADPAPLVRLEALRALRSRSDDQTCDASLRMIADGDMSVALVAIDQLGGCATSPDALAALERAVADRSELNAPRGWHRSAHALIALAIAAPDKAAAELEFYAASPIWQVRMYAARAAGVLRDRATLQRLSADAEPHVANAAAGAMGADAPPAKARPVPDLPGSTAAELRRLASPTAVITIKDVGRVEIALITAEAPAAVLRFAQLAESGYFDGLAFDRIAPNAVVQAGSHGGADARYELTEIGTWPHVRGTVGLSMPDTSDAQFFVDLVDNPRFDHQYPVVGQVLNGADVVDELLEGDIIESISIVP